ncbi:MAG: NAD(P)H-hydrate dehydratase, partial [Acidimicrobiales bacterium]|nr:NAD(P)H-hydrate dehydratase [Acidimicrobiales bacterium]
LDTGRSTAFLVDDRSAHAALPVRARDAHKWNAAVRIIGGSPGMPGAPSMAAAAAQRAGAGMVQIVAPGVHGPIGPVEAVSLPVDEASWAERMLDDEDRVGATVVGPGLGTSMVAKHQVRMLVSRSSRPVVVDGDGLTALGQDARTVIAGRDQPTVLTPHDGEFRRLAGQAPGADRLDDVRSLASETGAVVLAKGPTTIVADPAGTVRLVAAGDERLATAGTGDVLSGVIAALLANGLSAIDAAAVGAHLHGVAGMHCAERGTVASDVIDALPTAFDSIEGRG